MTSKLLKPSDVLKTTYASFSRNGATVDLARFFRSKAGQDALERLALVREHHEVNPKRPRRG